MGLFGLSGTKTSTYDPMSAYTPEQRAAIQGLQSLASTGTGLGINLGEAYGGSLGQYGSQPLEQAGLARLMQSVTGGSPYMNQAADVYGRMANTQFNPDDPSSGFAAFQRQVARKTGEASDALNREAAMTGNRFGTAIAGEKRKLGEAQSDSLQSELARLWESSQNRQLAGAQGLAGLEGQSAQTINQAMQYGGLERELANQQAQAQYGEWQRQRAEKMGQLDLAQNQWQQPMGTITKKGPSTLMKMWGEFNPFVGSQNTHKWGYTTNQTSMSDFMKMFTQLGSPTGGGMGGTK